MPKQRRVGRGGVARRRGGPSTMHNGRVKVIAMARKQVVLVMVEMVELVLIRIPILILMLSAVLVVLLQGLPHIKVAGGASDSA